MNLILLISWSYSLQTGESIQTNASTWIYNVSHMVYNPKWQMKDTKERIITSLACFLVPIKIGYPILKKIVDYELIFINLAI